MNRRENHLEFLKDLRDSAGESVFSNVSLRLSISHSFFRVFVSTFLHARPFIYCSPSPLPSPQGLFCIPFLLLINYQLIFFAKVFTSNRGGS